MSMTVVPNPDGSYTVKCGDAEVTVGGGQPVVTPLPPDSPDEDPWPDPEENGGGVTAYLHLGRLRSRANPFDAPLSDLLQEFVVPPAPLARAIPGAALHLRRGRRGLLVLELQVPAGQPFDLEQLKDAAREMRWKARRLELHIYVEKGSPTPLGVYQQVELP